MEKNKKIRVLILDDSEERREWFKKHLKDILEINQNNISLEFVKFQQHHFKPDVWDLSMSHKPWYYDLIFLDNDLGEWQEGPADWSFQGLYFLKTHWLQEYTLERKFKKEQKFFIHTNNVVASESMKNLLMTQNYQVEVIPFSKIITKNM